MLFKRSRLPSSPDEVVTRVRLYGYEDAARIKQVTSIERFAGRIAMEILPTRTPADSIAVAQKILHTQAFQGQNLYNSPEVLAEQIRAHVDSDHVAIALTGHPDVLAQAEIAASDVSDEALIR